MKTLSLASSVFIGVTLVTRALALDVDSQLPAYKPVQLGSAEIKSVGSDTMGDLMRNWAAQFTKLNPSSEDRSRKQGIVHSAFCADRWCIPARRDVALDAKRRI